MSKPDPMKTYETHKCRLLRVYDLTEHEKLFLFRFDEALPVSF
jgi:hypothetical protein